MRLSLLEQYIIIVRDGLGDSIGTCVLVFSLSGLGGIGEYHACPLEHHLMAAIHLDAELCRYLHKCSLILTLSNTQLAFPRQLLPA